MMIPKAGRRPSAAFIMLSAAARVLSAVGAAVMLLVSVALLFLGTAPAAAADCGGDQVVYQAGAAADNCPQPTGQTAAALAALAVVALGAAGTPLALAILRGAMSGGDLAVVDEALEAVAQEAATPGGLATPYAGISAEQMEEAEAKLELAEDTEKAGRGANEDLENLFDAAPETAEPLVEGAKATQESPEEPTPSTAGPVAYTSYNPFQLQPAPDADLGSATARAMAFNGVLIAVAVKKAIKLIKSRHGG